MEGYQNLNVNFSPLSFANQTSSAILFIGVNDVSPSIGNYENEMTTALRDVFLNELRNSHRKDDILVKAITFNEKVVHKSGFIPLANVQDDYFNIHGHGRATALYQAVLEAMEHIETYRKDLEDQGVDVRCNITITTDGIDNESPKGTADKVKAKVEALRKNEAWAGSYTITMIGVGDDADFTNSCIEMGLDPTKCLSKIGTSAEEIRKQMGVVSKSVSSSSNGSMATF